jgi:C4-dicarboxylate-specific signal transduction histidine kinase
VEIMENLKSIEEITERIIELSKDMDFADYEETEEEERKQLQDALYNIKAIAQNELNKDYWRTLWNALQRI